MASRFNRYLRGWLGLLDSKVGGLTPTAVEENVRATLGTERFLYAQTREVAIGLTAAIANNDVGFEAFAGVTGGTGIVPEGEVWLVEHFSVRNLGPVAGGDWMVFAPCLQVDNPGVAGTQHLRLGPDSYRQGSTGVDQAPIAHADRPFVALPNDKLGVYLVQCELTAVTEEILGTWLFTRCPI